MRISRVMSTQHPDNANIPFFSEKPMMEGEDEVKEAFYAFSHLGVDEQLWDAEGKEVDSFVVKKLFSRYEDFFKKNVLGRDKFLTFRVPNPDVEKAEGKVLLEALHSIPRNFDLVKTFYGNDVAPIFEVVVPMCSSEKDLIRVQEYYKRFIIGNQEKKIYDDDITISAWIGALKPEELRVTPLFETKEAILHADEYVKKYVQFEKVKEMQRVWFARSDTALNYGSVSAVLLGKIGVQKLHELQEKISLDICPILGCGSAPFRGNFKPSNAAAMLKGYPSMQTFTIQSAFKYDYNSREVIDAVEKIKETKRREFIPVDVEFATEIIEKVEREYRKEVQLIADKVNYMTKFIPQRRKRKLHIGLFGYARSGAGVQLPRAINFCAALYSLGLPPDVLGLSVLSGQDLDKIRQSYRTVDADMKEALQYFNKENLAFFPEPVQKRVKRAATMFDFEVNEEHQELSSQILAAVKKNETLVVEEKVLAAARLRRFLG